ncbi:hypothetical protein [Jiangella endophytica]|uniref:hypothetical protein n=1 Tax=Jiangella endophytica TaxID=1623398 RepID=UPI00130060FD|nr:hypothetical protein [Jiangella endophytica]
MTAAKRFERAMRLMRRHDPQAREDGYQVLRGRAADHVGQLMEDTQPAREHLWRARADGLIG